MTVNDGRKLKTSARVEWIDGARGTVREATYAAIKIEWDDGKWCLMQFAGHDVPWKNLRKLGSSIIGPSTWPDNAEPG